jgi:hypothetical protein
MSVLLHAGPSLNFLAVRQENVLIQVAASRSLDLAVPARVEKEILGVCRDARFSKTPASATWKRLKGAGRVVVLDDTLSTYQFIDAVSRISGQNAHERVRAKKSLGEIMVLAHAAVFVQQGREVFVLIDEGDGRARAQRTIAWLRDTNAPGQLFLWSTRQVLKHASTQPGWIEGNLTWEAVYTQMRQFDDALAALRQSGSR